MLDVVYTVASAHSHAERRGLVRIKPAKKLPDLLKIHEFIRVHGFPPAGSSYTPPTVNFLFKPKRREEDYFEQPSIRTCEYYILFFIFTNRSLNMDMRIQFCQTISISGNGKINLPPLSI